MDTKAKLVRYRELSRTNPEAAQAFRRKHRRDKRFTSLVRLGEQFLSALRRYMGR